MLDEVSPVFHVFPNNEEEVITMESPWQKVRADPVGEMVGGSGLGFTVTTMAFETVEVHPKATRTAE